MFVHKLSLSDFRSYPEARISPRHGFVVVTGPNGAGKTNLLEAVSMLAPGRGLRGAPLSQIARQSGAGGFGVAASISSLELPEVPATQIGTGTLAAAPERRLVRVNGAPEPASALAHHLSIVWLVPAMDRLFADAPSARRRFLDQLVLALDPGHAPHAARYEAAMRARNKLLAEERPDEGWLAALEARMAEHGAALAEARRIAVAALAERLLLAPDGPFARPGLALADNESEDLAVRLAAGRARDAAAGRVLYGPHRADLLVTHLAKVQPASSCSTGEQKALLVAILLGHADLVAARGGAPPILLLDEIAAHLDSVRRDALFERLAERRAQVWMTGTERALFAAIEDAATWLEIEDGILAER